MLKSMLESRQAEQVIAYLTKMDETKRSKIIAEFVKDEPAVAADLLERMRTRGFVPRRRTRLRSRRPLPEASLQMRPVPVLLSDSLAAAQRRAVPRYKRKNISARPISPDCCATATVRARLAGN